MVFGGAAAAAPVLLGAWIGLLPAAVLLVGALMARPARQRRGPPGQASFPRPAIA